MKKIYKTEEGKNKILEKYKEILGSWLVENKQYTVKTRHGDTFVIESGSRDNPPIILLHGSVSNSFCWYGDVSKLSETHNVYAIDIIGEAGLSAENRPSYDSGAYSEWLLDVLNELKLNKASIVGLSLGGWMALSFATKHHERIDKLILFCPGGLYPEKGSFMWKAIFFSIFGKWGEKQVSKLINGGKSLDETSEGLKRGLEFNTLIGNNFNPRMDKLPIFTPTQLENLDMPTYILFGEFDYLLNAKKSIEYIKKYAKNIKSELLDDTGHVIVNQANRIIDFLREV